MNIDPQVWNTMSMDEKRAFAESLPNQAPDSSGVAAYDWKTAVVCSAPIFLGISVLALTFAQYGN